ncbi:uncharacterized protein [Cherax quadricarinatus]|uniref:uncharacterized protein n=1 Tax=Cherax quadricarinatus TaxID=27406 RepID=UPI00387E5454
MMGMSALLSVAVACLTAEVWAGEGDVWAGEGDVWAREGKAWAGEGDVWAREGKAWAAASWSGAWDEEVHSPGAAMYEGIMELGRQSTVYSFNFSNLFIIFALKMLVLFVLGGGFGLGVGRSVGNEEPWVDSNDALFITTYLVSDGVQHYDCLNRLSCLQHYKAHDLLTAGRMIINAARFMGYSLEKYERLTWDMEDAIHFRAGGGSCHTRYPCHIMPSL